MPKRILDDKRILEDQCRLQQEGIDAPALATEQREQNERLAAGNHELKSCPAADTRTQGNSGCAQGREINPALVLDFRKKASTKRASGTGFLPTSSK